MIVIDDGSTDNSAEIVINFSKLDNRIKLIKQKNGGSAAARNNGIRNASGRYIALLDADDLWEPEFLESQIKFMKEKNAVCVFSSYRRIDEFSTEIMRPLKCKKIVTYKQMLISNYIGCLTGLYDSQKYGKVYLREELKSVRDDYAYWIDIVKLEGKAYGNQKPLARYRITRNSVTGKKFKLIKIQFNFYRNYLKLGFFKSIFNTFCWGMQGFIKFLPV